MKKQKMGFPNFDQQKKSRETLINLDKIWFLMKFQALDRLVMVESDNDAAQRSKRTIGILRQLFPGFSQVRIETEKFLKTAPQN